MLFEIALALNGAPPGTMMIPPLESKTERPQLSVTVQVIAQIELLLTVLGVNDVVCPVGLLKVPGKDDFQL